MNPWLWFPLFAMGVLFLAAVVAITVRIVARSKVPRVVVTPRDDWD